MHFGGRWVSMELANAILLLWGVAVATLGVVAWCLWRGHPPTKPGNKEPTKSRHLHRQRQRERAKRNAQHRRP